MKAEITKITNNEKHYYNVHIDGEIMGFFKRNSKGVWMFSASAGSKSIQDHEAIGQAFQNLNAGFPEHSESDHLIAMGFKQAGTEPKRSDSGGGCGGGD